MDDSRRWSLESSGLFSVKFNTGKGSNLQPQERKSMSITVVFLQMKIHSHYISPSVWPLGCFFHIFFNCSYSRLCFFKLLLLFNLQWVISNTHFLQSSNFLWINTAEALFLNYGRKEINGSFKVSIFPWLHYLESARPKASSCCPPSKSFG